MGTRIHTHHIPYTPDQMYDLVADVGRYPEFLPWCAAVRVLSKSDGEIVADLSVRYKIFKETFRSKVHLTPKTSIEVEYIQGPFRHLKNRWTFENAPDGGTDIAFLIDFEFRNPLFQNMTQLIFEGAFDRMLLSFEKRAQDLYGKKD